MPRMNRRQFIFSSATVLGGAGLSACSSMDRLDKWIFSRSTSENQRIPIVGGGASGLMAAYTLKKAGYPFRVFEAAERWGGRIHGVQNFGKSQTSVDLGGEWIRMDHDIVISLARELKLSLVELKGKESLEVYQFPTGQAWQSIGELRSLEGALRKIASNKTLTQMDNTSGAELLASLRLSASDIDVRWFQSWMSWEWGAIEEEMSALQVLNSYQQIARPIHRYGSSWRMRFSSSARGLIQALHDRLVGVIPTEFMKLEHRLTRIELDKGKWKLTFASPDGEEQIVCSNWLCTLPWKTLVSVEGWELLFSKEQREILPKIKMGSHSKVIIERTRNLDSPLALRRHREAEQWIEWSLPKESRALEQTTALTIQMAGQKGADCGPASFEKFVESGSTFQAVNWSKMSLIGGSKTFLPPGQWLPFSTEGTKLNPRSSVQFAGEHLSSKWMGTIAGALETGQSAAERIMTLIQNRS